MSTHLDTRPDGHFALFIDGDLQFDTADEAIYHESLALPALTMARTSGAPGLRVLICGGGDGLALRECLRFPGVAHVNLVDNSAEIVDLGRTRFAEISANALGDPRVAVHIADAWDFLSERRAYDVILCDFTVPRRPEDTRVFSKEWYDHLRDALAPGGAIALNAVSPQMTPEAFWCLRRTVRSSGLHTLPYRVCIPSFRAQGYGAWAFVLAAHRPLNIGSLRSLECPVETRQADLRRLWRGARFSRAQRRIESRAPLNTLANPCLIRLLLNPGSLDPDAQVDRIVGKDGPYDLEPLLRAIPISHPYHTRMMIETLAAQVVGSVRSLDIQRLLKSLIARATDLPGALRRELARLRDFLRQRFASVEQYGAWGVRLFATLVLLITIANAIAPDNAFAKGSFGLGHVSFSRGFSGSFSSGRGFGATSAEAGSFHGGATSESGFSSGAAHGQGSFSGERGIGGSFGARGSARGGLFESPHSVAYSGFRRGYGQGEAVDIYGYGYRPRAFYYDDGPVPQGYGGYGGGHWSAARRDEQRRPVQHKAQFVADDDLLVLDNGDVVITISDTAFLRVRGGEMALMSDKSGTPLFKLYPAPEIFDAIRNQLTSQQFVARREVEVRRDWLSWAGWTSALVPAVAGDREEMRRLQDLDRRIGGAISGLGKPTPERLPSSIAPDAVELFNGCFLLRDDRIALCDPQGQWWYADGQRLTPETEGARSEPCPPALMEVAKGVMWKLDKELRADIASDDNDLDQLAMERASLDKDLSDYQDIFQANGYQGDYEVDYGTDSISVSEAMSRTQQDIDRNTRDTESAMQDRARPLTDLERIDSALRRYSQ